MGYIRKFDSYKKARKENRLNEAIVMKMDNSFKVKPMVDISQSLINSYVKKVKEETGKELRDFYSDMDLAEALVKYIMDNSLNIENIPSNAFLGQNAERAEDDSTGTSSVEEQPTPVETEETGEEETGEEETGEEESEEGNEEETGEEETGEEESEETGEEDEEEEGNEELPL